MIHWEIFKQFVSTGSIMVAGTTIIILCALKIKKKVYKLRAEHIIDAAVDRAVTAAVNQAVTNAVNQAVTDAVNQAVTDAVNQAVTVTEPVPDQPALLTDEKSEFDIMLEEVPADKKISILKVVRRITGLGLKEAKELVEATPKVIQEAVAKNTAEEIKKQIEEAGGKVSLK